MEDVTRASLIILCLSLILALDFIVSRPTVKDLNIAISMPAICNQSSNITHLIAEAGCPSDSMIFYSSAGYHYCYKKKCATTEAGEQVCELYGDSVRID
jgi:hypothetical protein